jgi:hypothetical protein
MIKDAYIENHQLVWIDSDDDEDENRVRDWSERSFNFGKGRCIRLDNESYNYEERLNNIKNKILDSESDYESDCEYDLHPQVSSDCCVS